MDDIATKFEYLKETKNLIKQAIIDKGITVSDTDTFRSYADKISSITVGETINNQNKTITENGTYTADEGYTGLGEVVVNVAITIPPSITTLGCRFWGDAIDNTGSTRDYRWSGSSTSNDYSYWYSRCGTNRGVAKKYSTSNAITWSDDSVKIDGTNIYGFSLSNLYSYIPPSYIDITLELVFDIWQYNTSEVSYLLNNIESGGNSIRINTNNQLYGASYTGTSSSNRTFIPTSYIKIPLNKRVYCCYRKRAGELSLFSSLMDDTMITNVDDTWYDNVDCAYCVGYNPNPDGSVPKYSIGQSYINVCSARIYSRYISDEEMMGNYKFDKERYNIPTFKTLTINPNVSTATVTLTADGYEQEEATYFPNTIRVVEGTEVAYSVSADGYTTQTGTITVNDTQTIDITL